MKIKIVGKTRFYLKARNIVGHPMHDLCMSLGGLDPKFEGENFTYEPKDIRLFLDGDEDAKVTPVTPESALGIFGVEGVLSFTGYPLWVSAKDADAELPAFFPNSTYYAEDDEDQEKPLQRTFAEWVKSQNHGLYDVDGVTFAGDFAQHGLDFAAQVYADAGYGLLEDSDAKTKIASIGS